MYNKASMTALQWGSANRRQKIATLHYANHTTIRVVSKNIPELRIYSKWSSPLKVILCDWR